MIVVGVDGSPHSIDAFKWAIAEASRRGLDVAAVQAWHLPAMSGTGPFGNMASALAAMEEATSASLAETVGAVDRSTVSIELRTRQGSPAMVLLEEAAEDDLLVVGSRGRGGFSQLLLGSVGHQCVTHGRGPVAVIPGPTKTSAGSRTIVVGIDGSPSSIAALAWAVGWAKPGFDTVTAVHAWHVSYQPRPDLHAEDPDPKDAAFAVARGNEVLDAAMLDGRAEALAKERGVELTRALAEGEPRWALVDQSRQADLLVVGATGISGIPRLLLGSTTNYVVHHASCPVVVSPRS